MHDIWNPWHGCVKCSEGCQNCYMYFLDSLHNGNDSSTVTKTSAFNYPMSKLRDGRYKIQSGELIRVCMTSDFFISDADKWRDEAWDIIRLRPDVKFFLLTNRPERVKEHLPYDWGTVGKTFFSTLRVKINAEQRKMLKIMSNVKTEITGKYIYNYCSYKESNNFLFL